MTRLERHLLVVVVLVALTALVVALPTSHARLAGPPQLHSIPAEVGGWEIRTPSSEVLLPVDRRSLESIGRVYERGDQRLWVAIARYSGENGPEKRPTLGTVVSTRGVTSIAREAVELPLDGAHSLPAMRLSVGRSGNTMTAWYWYHLGPHVIGGEYSLRFWLGLNTLLRREDPLFLVRVVTTDGVVPIDFIQALATHVQRLAGRAEGN